VQADVPHTFGTLLIPLAVVLVVWGIFLVERTVANPLSSDIGAILFGSVVLACGLLLIAYLLRAARVSAISQVQERIARAEQPRPRRMVQRTSMPAQCCCSSVRVRTRLRGTTFASPSEHLRRKC